MYKNIVLKNINLLLLIFLTGIPLIFSGCSGYPLPSPTPPELPAYLTEIVVQPDNMDLKVGESQTIISVTAYYSDSSTSNISLNDCTYYSYDSLCASVNSNGIITGISSGTTTIIIFYTEDIITKTDTITVNVTALPPASADLISIEVIPSAMNLNVGESQTISSVIAYYNDSSSANISLLDCNYSSDNITCATVSDSGTTSAISDGSAIITVSYTENSITKTDTVDVTVGETIQNEIVYRALCVGIGDYIIGEENDLSAPPYDVDRMCYILNKCRFSSLDTQFSEIWYLKNHSATKSAILQAIASVFSNADNNDISYFYFSGHGSRLVNTSYLCPADMTSYINSVISVDELENALSAIAGTKVVFIDSCHSGGFIGKEKLETAFVQEELESFNNDIINAFSQAQTKGLLTTNQYKVLTSCHYYQECWEIIPQEGNPFGVFTMALCEGCGYYGNYPADIDLNTKVSLNEAYLYIKDWVQLYFGDLQDIQVYPDNSTFTIMEY